VTMVDFEEQFFQFVQAYFWEGYSGSFVELFSSTEPVGYEWSVVFLLRISGLSGGGVRWCILMC